MQAFTSDDFINFRVANTMLRNMSNSLVKPNEDGDPNENIAVTDLGRKCRAAFYDDLFNSRGNAFSIIRFGDGTTNIGIALNLLPIVGELLQGSPNKAIVSLGHRCTNIYNNFRKIIMSHTSDEVAAAEPGIVEGQVVNFVKVD